MADVFVDTSGWGNLIDVRQPYHELASDLYKGSRQQNARFVTTNYIVAELVSLMISPLHYPRRKAIAFIDGLKSSPIIEIVNVGSTLDEQGWELLKQRQDKDWSLVDCVSFVVMTQRNIDTALTSDHHFEQAGFVRLLK